VDSRASDVGRLLLRVTVSGLLLFHGADKLRHGVGEVRNDLVAHGMPAFAAYGVFLGEVVAPVLILLGVFARPAALVCSGTVLFATALVHPDAYGRLAPTGAWAAESFAFYVLTALAVALLGAGRYSLRGGRGRWD